MNYPATDFIDAAVWPGRITSNGTRVTGFIYDARYQDIIESLTICNDRYGYHLINFNKWLIATIGRPRKGAKSVRVHQLLFCLQWGRWPEYLIDHINGKHDNRASNLRLITKSGNRRNFQKRKADGLPWGVTWCKKSGKYKAAVKDNNSRLVHLGLFKDVLAAAAAVDAFREELIAEDNRIADLMTRGIIPPVVSKLPRGVSKNDGKFRTLVYQGKKPIYLGTFLTASLASAAHEAARTIRDAKGTVEEMKQAARDAVAASLAKGGEA